MDDTTTFNPNRYGHSTLKKKLNQDESGLYVCDLCNEYSTPIRANLLRHLRFSHNTQEKIRCEQCTFECIKQYQLKKHIRIFGQIFRFAKGHSSVKFGIDRKFYTFFGMMKTSSFIIRDLFYRGKESL